MTHTIAELRKKVSEATAFWALDHSDITELLDEVEQLQTRERLLFRMTKHSAPPDLEYDRGDATTFRLRVADDLIAEANVELLVDLFRDTLKWELQNALAQPVEDADAPSSP